MAGKHLLTLAVLFVTLYFVSGNLIVETKSGQVKGVEVKSVIKNEKYYSFLGIPYGKPLFGELRFLAPEPYPGWEGILDATKEKKHCPQFNIPRDHNQNSGYCGEEDCLRLSIHTPKLPKNYEQLNLPVIVFIHNEFFKITNNGTKDYSPDFFMKEDVIVVIIAYRVGILGFLSFEDNVLPGNNGLRDIILALKWLHTNIHKFGGDTSRITLMGSSYGAALVDILLHSPKAKGLFSGAILQSGTSWSSSVFNVREKGRERARALGETLEIQHASSSLLIKELNRLPTQQIVEAEIECVHTDEWREIQALVFPASPVIEHDHPDAVISKHPDPFDITVPVMMGYNTREALESAERYLKKPNYLTFADRDFAFIFPIRTDYRFKINSKPYFESVQEVKDFYFDEGYVKIGRPGEFLTYLGDSMFFYAVDYTVRNYINGTAFPLYYYAFDYSGELNMRKNDVMKEAKVMEGTWGASLGDELCYLFVCKPIKKLYVKALEEDSEEIKVLRNMIKMWTNFAKTGNPTPPGGDFTWTPASKENKECLVISDELEMKSKLHEDRIQFWDDFLEKYKELAIAGVIGDVKDEL